MIRYFCLVLRDQFLSNCSLKTGYYNKTCSFCYVAIKIDFINVEKSVTKISNYIVCNKTITLNLYFTKLS